MMPPYDLLASTVDKEAVPTVSRAVLPLAVDACRRGNAVAVISGLLIKGLCVVEPYC